jgi:phosphoenolpyruvate carboxylase
LDEALNALYYLDDLFTQTVPEVLNDFAKEMKRIDVEVPITARPLSFGNWIGGDRDGNPNITAEVTDEAMELQVSCDPCDYRCDERSTPDALCFNQDRWGNT